MCLHISISLYLFMFEIRIYEKLLFDNLGDWSTLCRRKQHEEIAVELPSATLLNVS